MRLSESAQDFLQRLLVVDPRQRLSAAEALEHSWIKGRDQELRMGREVRQDIVNGLMSFARASNLRRATMSMMAWSLTDEERAQVRDAFLEMDTDRSGTITLDELKDVMGERFNIDDEKTAATFAALDMNHQGEIHYSEFLAATASTRVTLHEGLIKKTFHRFDVDSSGFISGDNWKRVFGVAFDAEELQHMFNEADLTHDGTISYDEFLFCTMHPELHGYVHKELISRVVDLNVRKAQVVPDAAAEKKDWSKGAQQPLRNASLTSAKAQDKLEKLREACCGVM